MNNKNITSAASQFQSELNNWFQTALDKAIHIALCVIILCLFVLIICVVLFCIVKFKRKKQIALRQKELNAVNGNSNITVGLENVSKNKAKQMGFQTLQDVSNVPPPNDGGLNSQHKDNMSLSEIRVKNMQMEMKGNNNNNSISGDSTETSNNNNNMNEGGEVKTKKTKGGNKKGKRTNKGSSRISKMNMNNNVNDNFEYHNYANTETADKEVGAKKNNIAKTLITEKDMEDELKKQMNKYQFS